MPDTWQNIGNIMGPVGPAGPPGYSSADTEVIGEVPSGAINGTNKNFATASNFLAGTLAVYLNGVRQKLGLDFTAGINNTFQMTDAPITGDILTVDYFKPATTTPIYVGTKARFVALANGIQLEVQDSGGTWQKQISYTE